jgi:hypothetical protein
MVLAEEFSHSIFRQSLARMFDTDANGDLRMAFNATMEVLCTKVCGLNLSIYLCPYVADTKESLLYVGVGV